MQFLHSGLASLAGVPMDGVEDAISSTMKSKRNYLLSRPTHLYNPRLLIIEKIGIGMAIKLFSLSSLLNYRIGYSSTTRHNVKRNVYFVLFRPCICTNVDSLLDSE